MKMKRAFSTAAEAQAFVEGLCYVNDSAIRDVEICAPEGLSARPTVWVVQFEDKDRDE